MGTIAKGEITLSPVNDAYTVLLTPSSCSVSADFDGSNPQLSNAKGVIIVKRGAKAVPFQIVSVTYSSPGIQVSWTGQVSTESQFAVTKLPNTILDGNVKFHIITKDGFNYSTEIQFSFNIVRESTMLDWIQDWEGSKTKVGGTYIMTPKLFVGKKEAVLDTSGSNPTWKEGALTGVYIGPDLLASGESSVGIYGYLKSKNIFHINADGGFIGGWTFNEGGLQSANGVVNILSEGTIFAQNPKSTTPYWGLYADGHAIFANGNVKFQTDGSAEFSGKITSTSGKIGGWTILENQIVSKRIIIDSTQAYVGINASSAQGIDDKGNYIFPNTPEGGVKMWYTSNVDFGFAGWKSSKKIFQLGSMNFIAGWNFDDTSFWSGTKNNSVGEYTASGITIGSNGIRGIKWRIDSNGDVSFMNGKIAFTSSNNSGEIVGWKLNESRFSTDKITLVSDNTNTGLYMSAHVNALFNSRAAASLENFINSYGGIYLKVKADSADLAAYDLNGKCIFNIKSNGVSHIAGWNFDSVTLYTGTAVTSGYTKTGEITLGPTGLRGYKWRFENDGSGALAGDKIRWDKYGNLTVDAKISADNITSGTISTANIRNASGTWYLNQDGSGALANGNIVWTIKGETTFTGKVIATSGEIGGFNISFNHIGVASSPSESGDANWAALSIYRDFFKVGGAKGYVMFGNDVIPSSYGGAFTAAGRIVNQAPNIHGNYGFDQANYGLFINVTGGTKNYGINSNAALMAPAFINTKAKLLTFTGSSYTLDFSQCNIILMYYNDPNYSGVEVSLPSEASVAYKFGLSYLPNDFATLVIFRVRIGSKKITLKGIYNHNEGVQNYDMLAGDSIMLLITKADGFRYQILNYNA